LKWEEDGNAEDLEHGEGGKVEQEGKEEKER